MLFLDPAGAAKLGSPEAVREAVRATVIAAQDADKGLLEVREERATPV